MTKVSIVYHSGYGHTAVIAEAVARGVKAGGADVNLIKVSPEGKIADTEWDILDQSDAIIFGAPTYMGSVSGPFKMFMDATSKPWFTQKWKNKLAGGFTNSGSMSGDKMNSLVQLVVLSCQQGMIWVGQAEPNATSAPTVQSGDPAHINRIGSYLGVMAQSDNAAPDATPPQGDIKTAELYGTRLAEMAKRWVK